MKALKKTMVNKTEVFALTKFNYLGSTQTKQTKG